MRKIAKFIFSRNFMIGILVFIQALFLFGFFFYLNNYFAIAQIIFYVIGFSLILFILSTPGSPSTKLSWVIIIMAVPFLGTTLYIIAGNNYIHVRFKRSLEASTALSSKWHRQNTEVAKELKGKSPLRYRESDYIFQRSIMPVHKNTQVKYFPLGDDIYKELKKRLQAAKHFIFIQFFIVDKGEMLNEVLEILSQKVKEGVEVRFMYDDIGCGFTLPFGFDRKIEQLGIKLAVFNPLLPVLNVAHNNRNHRKTVVIDGYIGFTGGFNLADEYINRKVRFGHWKDSGIMLMGEGVWNQTMNFLEDWDFTKRTTTTFDEYSPFKYAQDYRPYKSNGYVQPFGDNPLDHELLGECVYMNTINHASNYIYITTPYLVPDHELINALCLSAKNGVDVRIITPHIPDKRMVFLLTRSNYGELINSGVRIYEYTPGFIHAKNVISDDEIGICGTINLDYRSMYHNFECACWMYKVAAIKDMKKDFLDTLKVCKEVTKEEVRNRPLYLKIFRSLLRIIAPLV